MLGVYSWSLYTTPAALAASNLTGNTTPNDPNAPGYVATWPSWIGETFTFNGGTADEIEITDDDPDFEDGYVETGAPQTLTTAVTIDGTTFPAGSVVENEFALVDASGLEIYVVRIAGQNVGFTYSHGDEPTAGDDFTATVGLDGSPDDNADGQSSSMEPYANHCATLSSRRNTGCWLSRMSAHANAAKYLPRPKVCWRLKACG
jgi:hypothetical protein